MRILAVTSLENEPVVGVQVRQLEIFNALARLGHHVQLVSHGPVSTRAALTLERRGRFFPVRMIRKMTTLTRVDLRSFDVVQVESPPADSALAPWLRTRRIGPPIILDYIDFHSLWPDPSRKLVRAYLHAWDSFALRVMSDYALVVSEGMRKAVASRYELETQRIFVVPNGVDVNSFGAQDGGFLGAFARNPSEPTEIPIAYVGNISPHLNFEVLLRASESTELDPRIRFVIVGGTDTQLAAYRKQLSHRAPNRFRFLGSVPHSRIPFILRDSFAGIICYPTGGPAGEAQTMKLLEYMAAGLPVISTRLAGVMEVLGQSYELFFAGNRPDILVQMINRLAVDPELGLKIGVRNAELAREYSWDNIAQRLLQIYLGILSHRQS